MNYRTLRLLFFCSLCLVCSPIWGQLLPTKIEIDSIFNARCDKDDYLSAYVYIMNCANQREKIGDKRTAIEYRLRSCGLFEKHPEYFKNKGITIDDYFINNELVSFLYRDLGLIDNCIATYLDVINNMKLYAPDLLPAYTSMMATTLGMCTTEQYKDSVYSLSLAMDYITNHKYKKKDIQDLVWMANCFYMNRFYNSFENNIKINDKIDECDSLFNRYKGFINKLDTTLYKDDIVKYYFQYIDILRIRATTASAQENNNNKAINLYKKGIDYLTQIETLNDSISLKIASFYCGLANEYYLLGYIDKSKENVDKAFSSLAEPRTSLDYCSLLSQISLSFWNLNQPETTASIKKAEIELRKRTPMKPSISDYALYMMYNQKDTSAILETGKLLELQYGNSNSSMANVYRMIADAYSKRMHSEIRNGHIKQAEEYKRRYDEYIEKCSYVTELYKDYFNRYNLQQNIDGNLFSTISAHYARLGQMEESFIYSEKALSTRTTKDYYDVSLKAASLHNNKAINYYLPKYYSSIEDEIMKMLPLLGSVEAESYLQEGAHPLYTITEWATWNPTDSVSTATAYNASLLLKGLYMHYSSLVSIIGSDELMKKELRDLHAKRDTLYLVSNESERMFVLHDYEMQERALRVKALEETSQVLPTWKDIQNVLGEKEIAIEFLCYKKNNYLWINDTICNHYIALIVDKNHNHPIVIDLFDEEQIQTVYTTQPKSYSTQEGYSLYKSLWGKLDIYIKDATKVFFSPMGLLDLVNIESLTDDSGSSASEKYTLYRLSSTKELLKKEMNTPLQCATLFGGINYTYKPKHRFNIDSLNTRGNWAYLKSTNEEISYIKKTIKSKTDCNVTSYSGDKATEETFKNCSSSDIDILHIATHGFFIPENKRKNIPYYDCDKTRNITDNLFYSGLVFSGGQDTWNDSKFQLESNDGILSSYEISKMNLLHVSLVVLSACETGIGDRSYDGIIGLQRAFKMAGAKTIIMSLWKVDDAATALMMTTFYDELIKTGSKHIAFKHAQQYVRYKYDDPYYWASFIMLD